MYRIFLDLREDYLDEVSEENYELGNWRKYADKFKITPSIPLTLGNYKAKGRYP